MRHINVSERVKLNNLHCGWDDHFQTFILDEDKLCDDLEDLMVDGGNIVDFHSCDFFPERWFDLVVVLSVDNTVLFDRLEARSYPLHKIRENIECEIMQVLLQDAMSSYDQNIVHNLRSENLHDLHHNVERIALWAKSWQAAE